MGEYEGGVGLAKKQANVYALVAEQRQDLPEHCKGLALGNNRTYLSTVRG